MAACRVDLIIRIPGDMNGMSSKPSPLPGKSALLRQETGNLTTDQLVADRLLAEWVQFVDVGNFPSSPRVTIVVHDSLLGRGVLDLLGIEGISILIFQAADLARTPSRIYLEDSVIRAIYICVDAETEKVLVIMGIDTGIDLCSPSVGIFAWAHSIGVENTGQFDL